MIRCLLVLSLLACSNLAAWAQVIAEVRVEKRIYAPGEPVMLTLRAQNPGKAAMPFEPPTDAVAGLTIWRMTDAKPVVVQQGEPTASGPVVELAPEQVWEAKVEITAKLPGDGAYEFAWKTPGGIEARMGSCAIWSAEHLAELEDTVVVLETSMGPIGLGFAPRLAPFTVQSFVNLARNGFYKNLTFHRVIAGFMMQGGDPAGTGGGNAGYRVAGEFNDTKHERGTLSMARERSEDSASCQFFIVFKTSPHLDGKYAAFGRVLWGFDAVDKVEQVMTDHHTIKGKCMVNHRDLPLEDVKITGVQVGPRQSLEPKDGAAGGGAGKNGDGK